MKTETQTNQKIIGQETTYIGHDHRLGKHGEKVLVTGIFRYDEDEDSDDQYIIDDDRLAELGGVRPQDGAEIKVWIETKNRWSFIGDELETITDLECFSTLNKAQKRSSK